MGGRRTIRNSGTGTVNAEACDTYTWTDGNGQASSEGGEYVWEAAAADGCDRTVTLQLTSSNSVTETVNAEVSSRCRQTGFIVVTGVETCAFVI